MRQVLNLIHDELKTIDEDRLTTESLYYVDEETGDMTQVAEMYGSHSLDIVDNIKKKMNKKLVYSLVFQKTMDELTQVLSGNEFLVLVHLIAKMGYENAIFGITYRGLSKKMHLSLTTVSKIMNAFMESNIIKRYGGKHKKVYYVNPAIAWKGSKQNMRKKTAMFLQEKKIENPRGFYGNKKIIGDDN